MTKKSKLLTLFISGIAILSVFTLNSCATEQTHRAMAEEMIQSAKTSADHETIAEHYEQEAEAAMAKADNMRKHIDAYTNKKPGRGKIPLQKYHFIGHCKTLIAKYEEVAHENRELANLHRRIAAEN